MKKLKWGQFIYKYKNIHESGEFRIEQYKSGEQKYRLYDSIGSQIGNGFKKLSTAKKVAQLIHEG